MPEGDAVWRTARRLHTALAGHELTTWDLRWPSLTTSDCRGRAVEEVRAAGKHLMMRIDGGLTLHSHLRMDGSWRLVPAQRLGAVGSRGDDIRAVVGTTGWTAIGHRLGMLDLVATVTEHTLIGHLGPDVLGPAWDPDEAARRIVAQGTRPIGEALMDQRVLAGLGTIYASESLFLRGIPPWTPSAELAPDAARALVDVVHRVMTANRDRSGQVFTGETRPGRRTYVYGRARRPCRRCGVAVRSAPVGTPPRHRTLFYCPACQRRPAG